MVCKVQHHSAGLSQTKNIPNSVSQYDLTTSKLALDNITNKTEPPNNSEKAKDRSGNLVDIYYLQR